MRTRTPTIWINVTTSANWDRPVVGVVRVEISLCTELRKLYADRLRECDWQNDRFIERPSSAAAQLLKSGPPIGSTIGSTIQHPPAHIREPGRFARFLSLLRKRAELGQSCCNEARVAETQISTSVPEIAQSDDPFVPGDILISVGLDWNYEYRKQFHSLREHRGIRVITCCYDLIPVLYPQYCAGDVRSYFQQYFLDLAWGSDVVLCISRQSERDLKRVLGEMGAPIPHTEVITLGDNVPISSGVISEKIIQIAEAPFLLYVSTIERRKNHQVLYRAYRLLCEGNKQKMLPKLVFVGMPGWGVGDFLKDVDLDPLTKGLIEQFHSVNDAELKYLYERALFCLYPSFYEGWGLPVGEALATGKVVLCSDRGSIPEVGGELVIYLDPWNPCVWADAIWSLVSDPKRLQFATEKVRNSFSKNPWDTTAKKIASAAQRLMDTPREIDALPGYAMSTNVGEKAGSLIRSTGKSGCLMFGPHWGFDAGLFRITIWDITIERIAGLVKFDVVSKLGQMVHWAQQVEITLTDGDTKPLLDIYVILKEPVNDLEIRCELYGGALTLSRLRIREITDVDMADKSIVTAVAAAD